METVLVIMLKDGKTGFLEKELASMTVTDADDYIVNLFACDEDGGRRLHIRLSTARDVSDWEYEAIFDYYDTACFDNKAIYVNEIDDDYNPAWEVVIDYTDDTAQLERQAGDILSAHRRELADVFETIADKEDEYNE